MLVDVINKNKILILYIFLIFNCIFVDLFILNASIFTPLFLLIIFIVSFIKILAVKNTWKNKGKDIILLFFYVIISSLMLFLSANLINHLILKHTKEYRQQLNEIKKNTGQYPSRPQTTKYLGYIIYYSPIPNRELIRFDKFNYKRQSIDLESGNISAEREI